MADLAEFALKCLSLEKHKDLSYGIKYHQKKAKWGEIVTENFATSMDLTFFPPNQLN